MKISVFYTIISVTMLVSVLCLSGCSAIKFSPTKSSLIPTHIAVSDGGFLSGSPCSAPCFYNITPGITNEKQALEILLALIDIKSCDHWEKNDNGLDRGMKCSNIGLSFTDASVVNEISFNPSAIVTVNEVVKKYGEPNAVLVTSINPSNSLHFTSNMMLYYDSINTILVLLEQKDGFNLQPHTQIESIWYSDRNSYKLTTRYSQKWHGYGFYDDYNP